MFFRYLFFVLFFLALSCDSPSEVETNAPSTIDENTRGAGVFEFENYEPFQNKELLIHYFIPDNVSSNSEILFVFHGNSRNAVQYRNNWIDKANERGFIVLVPKFSTVDFPGGDMYNLGNVFDDGDNPSPDTLNPEEEWTFSVIEPIFDHVKTSMGNQNNTYNIFGFSAGGQFAHRYVMFKPDSRIDKVVASGSGWYTVPDINYEFPYGINNSPIQNTSPADYFNLPLTIQIGTLDNDPNASALRRNSTVDIQGTNRFARAFYMYNTSKNIAENLGVQYNWDVIETPGNDHDNAGAIEQAVEIFQF